MKPRLTLVSCKHGGRASSGTFSVQCFHLSRIGHSDCSDATVDLDSIIFGVLARYALSKRTTLSLGGGLYAGGPIAGNAHAKTAVGMTHFFRLIFSDGK